MEIVIAPDSFKECLDAPLVAERIERGIRRALPDARVILVPMSDGGEGFTSICISQGGDVKTVESLDPIGRAVLASYGIKNDRCIIDIASASGLALLTNEEKDPMLTSTRGTGILIKAALDAGYRKFIVGLGGSATHDGGAGIAQALGARLLDKEGEEIGGGARELGRLKRIDLSVVDRRLAESEVIIATDVTNTLSGESGAALVFSRQKGARECDLPYLDEVLARYADYLTELTGRELASLPGSGAAGGAGVTLHALFGKSEFQRGISVVAEVVGLVEKLATATHVVTGEGAIDGQSLYGKVPVAVASYARHLPVIAVVGTIGFGYEAVLDAGVDLIIPLVQGPSSKEESLQNAPLLLEQCGFRIGKFLEHCSLSKKGGKDVKQP